MTPSEVGAICRLCTKTSDLLWVFNQKIKTSQNFKDVIAITTGIEINKNDGPSQFVCKKCLECAIRMYQFRIKAQNSNKLVIDQYDERSKKLAPPPVVQTAQVKIHPSVTALLNIYPTINVPSSILKKNLSPLISLPMNYVKDYFRSRNLDMDEAVWWALRSMRTKRPKNPPAPKRIKAKDRKKKSPKSEGIDSKPGLISPINIKVNSTEPSYEIVKKHLDKNGNQPRITEKEYFTELLGLLPIKSSKNAPTHEKKDSVQRTIPADVSRKDKLGIKRKKKNETLFEESLQLLNRMQQSKKRPGSCEPPVKKQKIENPATVANMKETEQGDEVIQPMEQNGEKSTNIAKLAEACFDESKLDSAEVQESKKDLQKANEPIISTPPPETAESPKKNFEGPIELTIDKQEQCYMCHVCNVTEFDRRGLKRHMLGHMRCPFCKKKFKSFESADEHIWKVCPIFTSMKNLPNVCLSRIELDDDLHRKYPLALEEFFPPKLENVDNEVIIAETKEQNPEKLLKTGDVIEILSVDEGATSKTSQNVMEVVDISQVKQPANVGSCSTITPSIGLKNSRHHAASPNLLSRDSRTEQQMLKASLCRSRWNDVSSFIQTFMPGDVVNNKESSHIRLIGLKAQLHVNKIPLTNRNGPLFLKLRKSLPKQSCPQLMKWDDLTPYDIVETATTPSSLAANALTPMENAGKRMVLDAPAKALFPTAPNEAQTILAPTHIPSGIVSSSTKSSTNPMPTAPVLNSVIVATFNNNPPFNSVAVEKPSTAPNTEPTSAVARCHTAKESLPVPTQALVSHSYEASIAG